MNFTAVAEALLQWAETDLRGLPWRSPQRDPYHVWISEVMLQQTRVETVIPYFQRWLERFPTTAALAAANLQDVLKAWEGLGYYSRARNLHRAAQRIVAEYNGELPADRAALERLPGIGRYTAGAILSLAYGQPEPALDGNLKRVLSRLADVDTPLDQHETQKHLWEIAQTLVDATPAGEAGRVNEALMDLGATICLPQNPRCLVCPLAVHCQALAAGTQNERPMRAARKPLPHYQVTAGVIWGEGGQLLITRRPPDGLLGGLWEFPGGKLEDGESLEECLRRELHEELAIHVEVGERLTVVEHAYTHFRITLHAFHCRHCNGEPQAVGCAGFRWVRLSDLDQYPFPAADHRIIAALRSS